jgi:uncharacterized protein YheU (UPF0270 family)
MSDHKQAEHLEEGIRVPLERIDPVTLRNMVSEFVTREWEELGGSCHTLDDKIEQVLRQLRDNRAEVVYDLASESWNIVVRR